MVSVAAGGRARSGARERGQDEVAVKRLVDRRGGCRLVYEPIADLARGEVCGYEAVVRLDRPVDPEQWRLEATRRGLEKDLDAFVVGSVLHARESLPPNCFLSFNVRAEALLRDRVRAVLARGDRLDGLVVEICSRVAPHDVERLIRIAAALREDGAKIAIDGVGSGIATLQHAMALRPEFVKLDAHLVVGVDRDDVRRAVVETIGELASRLDGWIVAQGVERIEELDTLMSLRVPLAQGSLIGVPTKTLTPVAFALSAYVRERGAAGLAPGPLAALLERPVTLERGRDPAELAAAFAGDPGLSYVPLLDGRRRPVGMAERASHERGEPPAREVLAVAPCGRIAEVLRRAMLRPPATRFHPVVCCDGGGRYVGIARIERLVTALAAAREG
jgi:EAL domain-containing protein (putative c-di-GMP-specific phosphodiesterase class I)